MNQPNPSSQKTMINPDDAGIVQPKEKGHHEHTK